MAIVIVRHGETGFVAKDTNDFVKISLELLENVQKTGKNVVMSPLDRTTSGYGNSALVKTSRIA